MDIKLPYVENGPAGRYLLFKTHTSSLDMFVSADDNLCITNLDIELDKVHAEAYHNLGSKAASMLQCRLDGVWKKWLRHNDLDYLQDSDLNTHIFVLARSLRTVMPVLESLRAASQR